MGNFIIAEVLPKQLFVEGRPHRGTNRGMKKYSDVAFLLGQPFSKQTTDVAPRGTDRYKYVDTSPGRNTNT